jgi:lipopolysaccharide/colanic/teichoic acid biosynthesis glycosyltransferase
VTGRALRHRLAKRAIDIACALLLLAILVPLLVAIAIAVCLDSPGPPLFLQRRVGRGGRPFTMWKYRTMVRGAEAVRGELLALSRDANWLALDHDPRVTRLGRLLRRTSLDELPQLVNVLKGDMSLVGPRPLPVEEHARVPDWASCRTAVRPGLTGPWQVGGRSIRFETMLELDRDYAGGPSLWLDAKIVARTLPAVLSGRGAR